MAKKINTHQAASDIAEYFDEMLIRHNISIKTIDPNDPVDEDEQEYRESENDTLGFWSEPFDELQTLVEEYLIKLLEAKQSDTAIESGQYPGTGRAIN